VIELRQLFEKVSGFPGVKEEKAVERMDEDVVTKHLP
jgi:hypothetical protein